MKYSCTTIAKRFGGILFICGVGDVLYSPDGSPELSNNRF
jgi:hypothetical protein